MMEHPGESLFVPSSAPFDAPSIHLDEAIHALGEVTAVTPPTQTESFYRGPGDTQWIGKAVKDGKGATQVASAVGRVNRGDITLYCIPIIEALVVPVACEKDTS
jgi:hypothetical protein